MNLWLDGLNALTVHTRTAFVVFLIILWGFFVARGILYRLAGDALTDFEVLAVSASGWVIPVLSISLIVFGISLVFSAAIGGMFAIISILLLSLIFIKRRVDVIPFLLFLALLAVSVVLRFAFLNGLVLPSYFDSAEHYKLISSLNDSYGAGILSGELTGNFYHLGFHLILSSLSFYLHMEIVDLMLVFGQLVLALLPFPLYLIIKRETDSLPAAVLSCLLFGFGFHMPAHLMNWGKYPALLGLSAMQFVLVLAYMAFRVDLFQNRRKVFFLLGASLIVSTIIHSRTLIVFGLLLVSAVMTFGWQRLQKQHRNFVFFLPVIALIVLVFMIQNNAVLKNLLNSYLRNDVWILILVLLLTISSSIRYTPQTFFLLTWLALCVLSLFVPIPLPSAHGTQTPLDRPFIQMFAVIPFSILGGLGSASLTQLTRRLTPKFELSQRFISFLILGLVLLNVAFNYKFRPSDCCRFATHDDLAAFSWMDRSLPPKSKVLIASSTLYVTSYESAQTPTGVDAGIWIPQLLSHSVFFPENEIEFERAETHTKLCTREIEYIYVGGMPQSFNSAQLDAQPLWYIPSFSLPRAKVYQLAGCQE